LTEIKEQPHAKQIASQWLLARDFIARISPEITRRWAIASAV
jgi:hypothetical protein